MREDTGVEAVLATTRVKAKIEKKKRLVLFLFLKPKIVLLLSFTTMSVNKYTVIFFFKLKYNHAFIAVAQNYLSNEVFLFLFSPSYPSFWIFGNPIRNSFSISYGLISVRCQVSSRMTTQMIFQFVET